MSPFALPRLGAMLAVDDVGFHREAGVRLGFYEPGERPQIYDPVWNRVRDAAATETHEQVHQTLIINTHHGLLTQLLAHAAQHRTVTASRQACLEEQWSVQELAATYAELAFVWLRRPTDFEPTVRGLPNALLGQPPYRQLFDAANALLPVNDGTNEAGVLARWDLVIALAACSMQSGCLAELVRGGFDDVGFAEFLRRESPHVRFECMVQSLGEATLVDMAREGGAAIERARDEGRERPAILGVYMELLARSVTGVSIEPPSRLQEQAQRAADVMAAFGPPMELRNERERSAEFVDAQEKPQILRELVARRPVTPGEWSAWCTLCKRAGELHLVVSDTLGPEGVEFSGICLPHEGAVDVPDDLRGIIAPGLLIASLEEHEGVPRAITFVGASWRWWYDKFALLPHDAWIHRRLQRAVRISAHRRLSDELLALLLSFEDIADGARGAVLKLAEQHYAACFWRPDNPRAYAVQKVPSDAALALVLRFIEARGIAMVSDVREIPDHPFVTDLLYREMTDPPDLARARSRV